MDEIIITKYQQLFPELNERQRRLWAASEAKSLGYGGVIGHFKKSATQHLKYIPRSSVGLLDIA